MLLLVALSGLPDDGQAISLLEWPSKANPNLNTMKLLRYLCDKAFLAA